MRELWVWMNGERVGVWTRGRTGRHRLIYDVSWSDSPRVRPLSLSLPISADRTVEGDNVGNFFDNLLPDSEPVRKRLSRRFNAASTEAFDLLQAIGRDCAGAVQLLPPEHEPVGLDQLNYSTLTDAAVEEILARVPTDSGPGAPDDDDDFRISIAGAQEKTALLRIADQWCKPKGATPTTHILKLPLGLVGGYKLDLTHSIENEWLCACIMDELGLPAAETAIATFGTQKALVVTRFDRQWMDGDTWIARLPQEDLCQVLGRPSQQKYESHGGPGIDDCLKVLAGSADHPADGRKFLCAQLVFWLLAAIDGHAKNFSIFLLQSGRYRLTPFYDVLSAWPVIGEGPDKIALQKAKLAMAVRGKSAHYKLVDIKTRQWWQLAQKSGIENAWQSMLDTIETLEPAIAKVNRRLPPNFPEQLAESIYAGMRKQVTAFRQGLARL